MHYFSQLEEELLKTLSFYEPMSSEYIFIDLDDAFLQAHSNLTIEDLDEALKNLVKLKKIRQIKDNDQVLWIKIFPKKSFKERLRRIFRF